MGLSIHINPFSLILYLALAITKSSFVLADILRLTECGKYDVKFSKYTHGKRLIGALLASFKPRPLKDCFMTCVKFEKCKTFNFLSGEDVCELNSKTSRETGVVLQSSKGWMHADTPLNQTKVCVFKIVHTLSGFSLNCEIHYFCRTLTFQCLLNFPLLLIFKIFHQS